MWSAYNLAHVARNKKSIKKKLKQANASVQLVGYSLGSPEVMTNIERNVLLQMGQTVR